MPWRSCRSSHQSHRSGHKEVLSTTKKQRVATQTHIKGLVLEASGKALPFAAGFAGQVEAGEASNLMVDMIRQKNMADRELLLTGPPGTNKTTLALRMIPQTKHPTKDIHFSSLFLINNMVGGSIKRHSFSEEDHGFDSSMELGYSGHNNHFHHGFVFRTLDYGTFYNRSFRSHSILSLRFGRFYDARFLDHQPHFRQTCSLCKKPLGDNRVMFMYRSGYEEVKGSDISTAESRSEAKDIASAKAMKSY